MESAAARRDRASGLGRYLSVESASCGLGRRAQEAIKTCRLELTDKRIWVSCCLCYHLFFKTKRGLFRNTVVLLFSLTSRHKKKKKKNVSPLPSRAWLESDQGKIKTKKCSSFSKMRCWNKLVRGFCFWRLWLSGSVEGGCLRNVAGACAAELSLRCVCVCVCACVFFPSSISRRYDLFLPLVVFLTSPYAHGCASKITRANKPFTSQ